MLPGVSRADDGHVQRIGLATSDDLYTWRRHGTDPLVEADRTWYERLGTSVWPDEAWRDPWVYPDPEGAGWHMLVTARAGQGPAAGRGVIGHARSADLLHWEVLPPLTQPAGFGHLEVPQAVVVDGQPLLLFCSDRVSRSDARPGDRIWVAPGTSLTGPWDLGLARPVPLPHLYAPRLVRDVAGAWQLIGFVSEREGRFVGELSDPMPVDYTAEDGLRPLGIT
jgi:beta-fructofuranosidase